VQRSLGRIDFPIRNIGEVEGILQVLITGGVHDMQDIDFASQVATQLEAIDPAARAYFERVGLTFTASKQG